MLRPPPPRDASITAFDLKAVAWDDEAMYACVCDSSWEVGLGAGQRQQAEFFGADCSQSGRSTTVTIEYSARLGYTVERYTAQILSCLSFARRSAPLHAQVVVFSRRSAQTRHINEQCTRVPCRETGPIHLKAALPSQHVLFRKRKVSIIS